MCEKGKNAGFYARSYLHTLDYITGKILLQAENRMIGISYESVLFVRLQPIGYFRIGTL